MGTKKQINIFKPVKLPADIKTFHDLVTLLYWLRRSAALRERPSKKDIKILKVLAPKAQVHLERFQAEMAMSVMGVAARYDIFTLFEFCDETADKVVQLRKNLPLIL